MIRIKKEGRNEHRMKLMLKGSLILLCLVMLLTCVSCMKGPETDASVPEGMKLATCAGADYRLYVPTVWNTNTDYGVSGAYYNMLTQSTVSAQKYAITEEMRAAFANEPSRSHIEIFWEDHLLEPLRAYALGGEVELFAEETKSVTLHKLNAMQFSCGATVAGKELRLLHVIGEKTDDAFYVLTFTVDVSLYERLLPDVQKIVSAFVLADTPYEPFDYVKDLNEDAPAVEGMKIASGKDVKYLFYVPTDWVIDRNQTVYAAYDPEDRSSVSVVPYLPAEAEMRVSEYFALCEERMINTAGEDYQLIASGEKLDLGGREATVYEYTYRVGETVYRYKQVIAAYGSMIYSLTYTATPENYDAHLDEVDDIIKAFAFR